MKIIITADCSKAENDNCKGLVFRGYRNLFKQDGRIELKQGIKLLKRRSCPGCEACGYLMDDVRESISCGTLIFPDIEDGAEYSVRITNMSRDWESGYVDDWDTEIFKITPKSAEQI